MDKPFYIQRDMTQLNADLTATQQKLDECRQKMALYKAAEAKRPAALPDTWVPILDDNGNIVGWMDPNSAAYKRV